MRTLVNYVCMHMRVFSTSLCISVTAFMYVYVCFVTETQFRFQKMQLHPLVFRAFPSLSHSVVCFALCEGNDSTALLFIP